MIEIDATLNDNFLRGLQDHTAGAPLSAEVKWTNLSRRQMARRMAELGRRVGRDVVSQLLRQPVISIDTKKKELLGDFSRDGRIDPQETIEVNNHDFGTAGSGVVIPHGVYDVGRN